MFLRFASQATAEKKFIRGYMSKIKKDQEKTKKVAKHFPGHNNLLRYKKQGMKFSY